MGVLSHDVELESASCFHDMAGQLAVDGYGSEGFFLSHCQSCSCVNSLKGYGPVHDVRKGPSTAGNRRGSGLRTDDST